MLVGTPLVLVQIEPLALLSLFRRHRTLLVLVQVDPPLILLPPLLPSTYGDIIGN